ncbi:MAG: sugar phosphate isomerase/epimerase [Victivallaceae bacterium]|nr:sugar phosphate isomerase/epimerase [Victivallaceae bacterium]
MNMFDLGMGVSATSLNPVLLLEFVAQLEDSRFSTFELAPSLFLTDYDHAVRDALRALCRKTGKRCISYHLPYSYYDDVSSPDESIRLRAMSRVRALFREAVFFDAEIMVLHPSTEPVDQRLRDTHLAQLRKSMRELEPDLRAGNLRLALEFLPRQCMGNTLSNMRRMLDGFPEIFGCCLDVNHLMGQYQEIPDIIRTLDSRLLTTHLSDYDGKDERHWLPSPGKGVVPWPQVLEALRFIRYQGPFNLEVHCDTALSYPQRIEQLENALDWLQTL